MKRALLYLCLSALAVPAAWGQQAAGLADRQMAHIEARLAGAEQQMERVRATRDPAERRKLLREHLRALREIAAQVRDLGRGFGPEMRAMMGGSRETPSAQAMMNEHDKMAWRIAQMDRMMEQLMQQMMGHDEEERTLRK